MKIEEKEVKVPRPPSLVVLTLTQEEAGLIRWYADYYATWAADAVSAIAAAERLRDRLSVYKTDPVYPYSGAFVGEE